MSYIDDPNAAFLVLAVPRLSEKDASWIDDFRKEHDKLFYGIVDPHFTIVFPTFGIGLNDFVAEVKKQAIGFKSFKFRIRCALINNDRLSEYCHVFLSPDEGNSDIVKLHDQQYSGILRKTQRLDIDYYSHIVIGSYTDRNKCKELTDSINRQNIDIAGSIDSLDIIQYGNRKVEKKENVRLG